MPHAHPPWGRGLVDIPPQVAGHSCDDLEELLLLHRRRALSQESGRIVGKKKECAHHGQIVQIEERDGLAEIKKDEMGAHQHVGKQVPPEKGKEPIGRDTPPRVGSRTARRREGCRFRAFLPIPRSMPQWSPRCRDISTKPQ